MEPTTKYHCRHHWNVAHHGHFNDVLHLNDKSNGNAVKENKMREFKKFLENIGLCELKIVGKYFTWTNGHVFSRVDKALANRT